MCVQIFYIMYLKNYKTFLAKTYLYSCFKNHITKHIFVSTTINLVASSPHTFSCSQHFQVSPQILHLVPGAIFHLVFDFSVSPTVPERLRFGSHWQNGQCWGFLDNACRGRDAILQSAFGKLWDLEKN